MKKPFFLYIINSAGICLFSYNFKDKVEAFEGQLLSGFISGISKFSEELNRQLNFTEFKERIPYIPINKSFEIMISYKDDLIGALIVEKRAIDEDMINFLDDLLTEFQEYFKDILSNWDSDIDDFKDFATEIERIFRKVRIFSFQIPKLKNGLTSRFYRMEEYRRLIDLVDGHRDINDFSKYLVAPRNEIIKMISNLVWNDIVSLSEKVYEEDIFEPKRDLFYLIRSEDSNFEDRVFAINDKDLIEFKLLKAIDGFKTVQDLALDFPSLTLHDIKHIISFFLTKGNYIKKVELFPQIISISDEVRNNLPPDSIALSYSLENICDGDISISEISKRVDVPFKTIKRLLDRLGNQVTYRKRTKK